MIMCPRCEPYCFITVHVLSPSANTCRSVGGGGSQVHETDNPKQFRSMQNISHDDLRSTHTHSCGSRSMLSKRTRFRKAAWPQNVVQHYPSALSAGEGLG